MVCGHMSFNISPGVADEGAGSTPEGLPVSCHMLVEIVLERVLTDVYWR